MKLKDLTNFQKFLAKVIIFGAAIFIIRMVFQFPIEYFRLDFFRETAQTRVFSKIDALKVIVFVGIFFALYYKNQLESIKHKKQSTLRTALYTAAALTAVIIYYSLRFMTNIFMIEQGAMLQLIIAGKALMLLCAAVLLFAAVFQVPYAKELYRKLKKPIIISIIAIILLYFLLMWVQGLWLVFSSMVTITLSWILTPFYPVTIAFIDSPKMMVSGLSLSIGPPCSGIDSMLLYVMFFFALYALDHKRIERMRFATFFLLGLVGVFLVNVLRLLLLILIGVHFSPEFAVGLFHTNSGWLFFVLYFLLYYVVIRRYIYLKG
jgi:exosortase/archaeosortase family protein